MIMESVNDVPQQHDESLSLFDHQEDEEAQVTEDVLSLQMEAWKLFELYERKLNSLHSTSTLYRERICESLQELHQHLLKDEKVQMDKIKDEKQKALNDLQTRESLLSEMCSSIATLLFHLKNGGMIIVDTNILNSFKEKLELLSNCKVPLHGHLSPIHTREWRGIRHVVKPLQKSLQFDPQSAHTNLVLSKNLKQVRFSPFARSLKSPDSFEPGLYVLGVPGFTSGQHYWEVNVGHKSNWIIGVVKESVPRKGPQGLEPVKGYWVLNKQGENFTCCGQSYPKSVRSPLRIGVFVDILDCYLAFYDVDTTSLLFEYTGCIFVGKLFPFFCPGVPAKEEDLGALTLLN